MFQKPNDEKISSNNAEISKPSINEADLENILDEIPEEHRKKIERTIIESSVMMRGMVHPENAIMNKISEEHITEYLAGARKEMENSFAEKKQNKVFIFLTLLITLVFFCIIILLLRDDSEVMEKIIYALIGLAAGAFGGYGVGKNRAGD